MSGALTSVAALLQPARTNPAVAAAVALLAETPPPLSPLHLDAAVQTVAPHLAEAERSAWIAAMAAPLCRWAITAPRCVAAFLGQCAAESGGFRILEEDLNYSARRLCEVWPSRFPDEAAAASCAGQPELLANTVYADRMGNGSVTSGDGWRFRGRGLIQITGRTAYERFSCAMRMTLDQAVQHAGTQQGAVDSAAWFWSSNGLNALAQSWSIDSLTRRINGGLEGAAERLRLCEAAYHAIGAV